MTHHTDSERAAYERELIDNHHYVPSDFSFKDGFYGGDDDYIQFGWDLWQAARCAPAAPVPQVDAIGAALELEIRAKLVESQTTERAMLHAANCLRLLAAAPQPPEVEENPLQEQLDEALQSLEFYKRRCDLLQSIQPRMRDPERTMVCDVLANGHLLQSGDGQPDKARYAPPEAAPVVLPEKIPSSDTLWQFLTNGVSLSALHTLSEHDQNVYRDRAAKTWATIRSEATAASQPNEEA